MPCLTRAFACSPIVTGRECIIPRYGCVGASHSRISIPLSHTRALSCGSARERRAVRCCTCGRIVTSNLSGFPTKFKCLILFWFCNPEMAIKKLSLRSKLISFPPKTDKSIASIPFLGKDKVHTRKYAPGSPNTRLPNFSSINSLNRYWSDGRTVSWSSSSSVIFFFWKQLQQPPWAFCLFGSTLPVTNIMASTFSSKLDLWPSRYNSPLCELVPRTFLHAYMTRYLNGEDRRPSWNGLLDRYNARNDGMEPKTDSSLSSFNWLFWRLRAHKLMHCSKPLPTTVSRWLFDKSRVSREWKAPTWKARNFWFRIVIDLTLFDVHFPTLINSGNVSHTSWSQCRKRKRLMATASPKAVVAAKRCSWLILTPFKMIKSGNSTTRVQSLWYVSCVFPRLTAFV